MTHFPLENFKHFPIEKASHPEKHLKEVVLSVEKVQLDVGQNHFRSCPSEYPMLAVKV